MDQDGRGRMPRPYSADLRERVIMDCEAGVRCAEAARRYRIGERTVYRWVRVVHVEGRRDAKPHSGGRPRVIAGTEDVLRRGIVEGNDATLAERADAYRRRTGRALSPSSVCRALKRLGWTRKKEDPARRGARAARCSGRARRRPSARGRA